MCFSEAPLYTIASVYSHLSFIIKPRHSEYYDSLRLYDSFKNLLIHEIWVFYNVRSYAFEYFSDSLMKLLLSGILSCKFSHEAIYILLNKLIHIYLF